MHMIDEENFSITMKTHSKSLYSALELNRSSQLETN